MKRRKKRSHLLELLLWFFIFSFVAVLVLWVFLFSEVTTIQEVFYIAEYWLTVGVVNGIILICYLMLYRVDAQNIAINENDLEDTDWLSIKKLRKMKEFTVPNWRDAKNMVDGIVIGAELKGAGVDIIATSQLHAVIVGTTGSGKTTGFVDQNIEILGRSITKPSLIITDPKKELYEKHAKQLEAEGYKITVLDLREPYSSAHWNPMNVLIRRIKLVKILENNLQNKDGKYFGGGEIFLSYRDAKTRVQELKDEIYENAKDFVYTLCPVQNRDQPNWEQGARNLILGLVLAMCEDCIKGKLDEKQLLLFNLYHNITKYCSEDTTALNKYLYDERDEYSKVRGLVNTVLITSDKTLTSYLSEVNSYIQQLSDDGILSLTSENDFDLVSIDECASAIFVIVPDERFTRHRFVTLFVTQLYKELVEKANLNLRRQQTKGSVLKRNTYFILDEFGNMPKFENLEGMVTVARSRGIRFLFVLQSFSQLTAKYGREIGDIVKTNCNVKIFIGSDDAETRKEFSELCGQKKIKSFSVNTNADTPASSSTGAINQPLITMGMLERLNGDKKGDAIISVRGYEPIWTRFTPSYLLNKLYFREGNADIGKREAVLFDKDKVVFDIAGEVQCDTEKIMEAIIRQENLPVIDDNEESRIRELDEEWDKVIADINDRFEQLSLVLRMSDARSIRKAKLESKVPLLYELIAQYDQSTAHKIRDVADYISGELPKLTVLQERVAK